MEMSSLILQAMANGLVIGVMYTLIAVGFTMVFGIMKVVNFAHGEFYMMGGFIALYLFSTLHVPFLLAVFLAGLGVAVIGGVISLVTVAPFRNDELNGMIAAIGVSVILQNVALLWFGAAPRMLPSVFEGSSQLGPVIISNQRLSVVVVGIVVLLAFWVFIQKTRAGKAMRAVAQDREAAILQGVNVGRIYLLAFALGVGLAGLVGAMMAPIFSIAPTVGAVPMLKAFIVVILGGLGSIRGAVIGGILLGLIESVGSALFGAETADILQLALVAFILIARPSGLAGTRSA